jgi:hypothetical protein
LRVCRVIRDEEAQISIAEYGGNSDQTCTSTWDNADILPSVFASLVLAVMLIVEVRDCLWTMNKCQLIYTEIARRDRTHDETTSSAVSWIDKE